MARFVLRRRSTSAIARERSRRPRIEILEDRLAPAISLNPLATFADGAHGPNAPPTVDSNGNVYAVFAAGSGTAFVEIAAGNDTVTTIAQAPEGDVPQGGLIVDGAGDVFGAAQGSEDGYGVFEVPAGSRQTQFVPAVIDSASTGVDGENIEGLATDGQYLYGLSVGSSSYVGDPTSEPMYAVWEVPVGGGLINVLASWQDPVTPSAFDEWDASGLMLNNNVLYGVTDGSLPGSNTVFAVPISGGPVDILSTFQSSVASGLVVSGGNVYGTLASGSLFKVPAEGGATQTFAIPSTVGQGPEGGLVEANGIILGLLENGGAAGKTSLFSVNVAPATPTMAKFATFASLNFNEAPISGLGVDSQGNAYGLAYGQSGVQVYELSGLSSTTTMPPPSSTPPSSTPPSSTPPSSTPPSSTPPPSANQIVTGINNATTKMSALTKEVTNALKPLPAKISQIKTEIRAAQKGNMKAKAELDRVAQTEPTVLATIESRSTAWQQSAEDYVAVVSALTAGEGDAPSAKENRAVEKFNTADRKFDAASQKLSSAEATFNLIVSVVHSLTTDATVVRRPS
jgi:hypothetical protein